MHSNLNSQLEAIQHTLSVWELTPDLGLRGHITIGSPNPDDLAFCIPDTAITAIRQHKGDPAETLNPAVQIILQRIAKRDVTLQQVASCLRLIHSDDEYDAITLWNLKVEIDPDGSLLTDVACINLFRTNDCWRVVFNEDEPTLSEAIRMAVGIATLRLAKTK